MPDLAEDLTGARECFGGEPGCIHGVARHRNCRACARESSSCPECTGPKDKGVTLCTSCVKNADRRMRWS